MNRNSYFILLFVSLLSFCCSSDESGNDVTPQPTLIGKRIKSVISTNTTGEKTISDFTYNTDGLPVAIIDRNSGTAVTIYEYDNGNITKAVDLLFFRNTMGETINTRKYKYDSQNRLIKENFTQISNSIGSLSTDFTFKYTYENNQIIVETIDNISTEIDIPSVRRILYLNEEQSIIKVEEQIKDSDLDTFYTSAIVDFTLNNNRIVRIEKSNFDSSSNEFITDSETPIEFIYDKKGRVVEKYTLSPTYTKGTSERALFEKSEYLNQETTPLSGTPKRPENYNAYLNLTRNFQLPFHSFPRENFETNNYIKIEKYNSKFTNETNNDPISIITTEYTLDNEGYITKRVSNSVNTFTSETTSFNTIEYILE